MIICTNPKTPDALFRLIRHCAHVEETYITYIQARVEQNMSERLRLTQNGIDQDDNRIVFNVLVHWLLA